VQGWTLNTVIVPTCQVAVCQCTVGPEPHYCVKAGLGLRQALEVLQHNTCIDKTQQQHTHILRENCQDFDWPVHAGCKSHAGCNSDRQGVSTLMGAALIRTLLPQAPRQLCPSPKLGSDGVIKQLHPPPFMHTSMTRATPASAFLATSLTAAWLINLPSSHVSAAASPTAAASCTPAPPQQCTLTHASEGICIARPQPHCLLVTAERLHHLRTLAQQVTQAAPGWCVQHVLPQSLQVTLLRCIAAHRSLHKDTAWHST
jgi:hypothetical protein